VVEGGIGQRNVSLTRKKNVALQCGCSVPTADWLDSSAMGIAHLVAHSADKHILCIRGGNTVHPKLVWDFLLLFRYLKF